MDAIQYLEAMSERLRRNLGPLRPDPLFKAGPDGNPQLVSIGLVPESHFTYTECSVPVRQKGRRYLQAERRR